MSVPRIFLYDSTLRDGQQTQGVDFSVGDKLAIAGFSPAAAALIAGLEQSPLLSEVRFGSPVTADPRVGFERFNISAEVASAPGG